MAQSSPRRIIDYWLTVWERKPPSELFAIHRAIPSMVIAAVSSGVRYYQTRVWSGLDMWIAIGVTLGVYLLLYMMHSLWSFVVVSPANLHGSLTEEIGELNRQNAEFKESLRGPELTPKEMEILAAVAEDPASESGVIRIINAHLIEVGTVCLKPLDAMERAEYEEAIRFLLSGGWIQETSSGLEPTAKGWQKGREILASAEGEAMMVDLRRRFPGS